MTIRALLTLLLVWISGCISDPDGTGPVWERDVVPIVEKSCLPCHRTGGTLPITLDSRDEFVRHGSMILSALMNERMPPGSIDRSGACGDFRGYKPVTPIDIDIIARFLDLGEPATGEDARAISIIPKPQGAPEALLLPRYAPKEESDDHRCFVLKRPPDSGAFITAISVERDPASSLHHLMIFSLPSQSALEQASTFEEDDEEPGFPCEGHPHVMGSELLSVWTPGQGTIVFPAGTGVATQGPQFLVQAHFHLDGHEPIGMEDVTLIVHTSDDVPTVIRPVPFAASGFVLQPGMDRVEYFTSRLVPFSENVMVHGVFPHMHTLGTSLTLEAEGEGETQCLAQSARWRFDWQDTAFFETPKVLASSTRLNLNCVWNTRKRDEITRWGEGSLDEMCTIFMFVSQQEE